MKEIKICILSGAVILFVSFFRLSASVNIYLSLVLGTFLLTALLFYKKPGLVNFKTVDILSVVAIVLFVYSIVFGIFKRSYFSIYPAALAAFSYLYILLKTAGDKATSKEAAEGGRLALRTGMYFDVEMRKLTEKNFSFSGLTKDLSTTGMKVFSESVFDKDDELYFRLYLPKEAWPLTGEAKVVWKKSADRGYEYGMVFTKMSDRDRGKLALKQGFSLLE
jgi:hypothetical protein